MDYDQIPYDEDLKLREDLERLRARARRNPYARDIPAEARAWLRYGALPGELSAGTDFEPSAPGLREPGGSLNAALHQVQQQLKRSVKEFVENPSAALGLGARRMDEDTRYALETDPGAVLGFVPPAARFIQVPRLRLRANRALPAPVRKAAGGSIAGTARRMLQRALPAWVEGWAAQPAPRGALSAVKPRGGNWLRGGELDRALKDLRGWELDPAVPQGEGALEIEAAKNAWIDNQLRRYIERDMATPQDPLDELFLRGEGHLTPEQLQGYGLDPAGGQGQLPYDLFPDVVLGEAPLSRDARKAAQAKYGEPKSAWGQLADRAVEPDLVAGDYVSMRNTLLGDTGRNNPWLLKTPPDSPVYDALNVGMGRLGFDHVLDWLEQSGIPPDRWKSISVPQAVRATGQWNKQLAKKAEAASRAAMEGLPRLKEYPSGYAWVELKAEDPKATERILDEEGDAMGHCVGQYCSAVNSGQTRILSLRNVKTGKPEVTIELQRRMPIVTDFWKSLPEDSPLRAELPEPPQGTRISADPGYRAEFTRWALKVQRTPEFKAYTKELPPRIKQIKGRFNAAPKSEMLPYVQDLVRNMGPWADDIGDLRNTGLSKWGGALRTEDEIQNMITEGVAALKEYLKEIPQYNNQWDEATKDRYDVFMGKTDIPSTNRSTYSLAELRAMATEPSVYVDAEDFWPYVPEMIEYLRKNPRRFE